MVVPTVAELFQPREDAMPIIDPDLKQHGRVWIPFSCIAHTSGVDRFNAGHPYPPSLCILYQMGRCHAGARCNQIHPDRQYVASARELLRNRDASNCCLKHGDLASDRNDFRIFCRKLHLELESQDKLVREEVPPMYIAITSFWENMMQTEASSRFSVTIGPRQICNLHQGANCKFGVDCRHVHLCRQWWSCALSRYPRLSPKKIGSQSSTAHQTATAVMPFTESSGPKPYSSLPIRPLVVSVRPQPSLPLHREIYQTERIAKRSNGYSSLPVPIEVYKEPPTDQSAHGDQTTLDSVLSESLHLNKLPTPSSAPCLPPDWLAASSELQDRFEGDQTSNLILESAFKGMSYEVLSPQAEATSTSELINTLLQGSHITRSPLTPLQSVSLLNRDRNASSGRGSRGRPSEFSRPEESVASENTTVAPPGRVRGGPAEGRQCFP